MSDLVERMRKEVHDAQDWHGETMKRWDEIRRTVEAVPGSDLPRLMFESLIDNLAEHMTEAADRIETLEAALREGVLVSREDFDDILESWEYAAKYKGDYLRKKHGDDEEVAKYREKYTSAALAPEQDK